MPMLPLVLSSDSHVFEPPDLWQTRIDRAFRDRAPRIECIDGGDHVVVEAYQILSGIGLISNAGARFEAPETISAQGRFEDVLRGGYDPEQHLEDMALDGVAGEVLYPSQGLFYFKVADPLLMSAIFRAYNDWLAEFCHTDPARLKGIAMINLDDVQDGIRELERAAWRAPPPAEEIYCPDGNRGAAMGDSQGVESEFPQRCREFPQGWPEISLSFPSARRSGAFADRQIRNGSQWDRSSAWHARSGKDR